MTKINYYERIKYLESIDLNSNECIEWPFALDGNGYGIFYFKKEKFRASRESLIIHKCKRPSENHYALHIPEICHNPKCVNPNHLYWGTISDNHKDMEFDNTSAKGERHPQSILTEIDVLKIREDCRSYRIIGNDYGVSKSCIRDIKIGKTWSHI